MKNGLLLFLFAIFVASIALPQSTTAPKGSSSPGKAAPKKANAKTVSRKTTSAKKGKSSKKSVTTSATAGRSRQMAPTPERYRDIQQALVERGYLKSEPNGVWDARSVDALRQFQADQKLSPTGKISSASLIGLGLGPKTGQQELTGAAPKPPESSAPPATPVPTPEN
jgi:peptidoglycan hydrolase-like protein with peptidoglycan-binding domain